MEHDEKHLPIDIRLLGALAEKVCSNENSANLEPIHLFYIVVHYEINCVFHASLILFTPYQCRAFAKALHYKEMEFEGARSNRMDANPVAVVEALIHINNQLHQHEVSFK